MDAYRLVEFFPTFTGVCSDSTRLSSAGAAGWPRSRMHSRPQLQIVRSTSSACWGRPASGSRVSSASSSTESRCRHGAPGPLSALWEAITHWPLYEALRDAGLDEGELGDASATSVQSLFERLAVQRPLVVVLDDLHWAEAALLDGMEHVAESSRGAAILIIAVARPELLETRPGWGGGKPNASSPSSNAQRDRVRPARRQPPGRIRPSRFRSRVRHPNVRRQSALRRGVARDARRPRSLDA